MKKNIYWTLLPLIALLMGQQTHAQISSEWTQQELSQANTVKNTTYLNAVEKEAVIVLNLARLYPKKFVRVELKDYNGPSMRDDHYKGSNYKTTLIKTMLAMPPKHALEPDQKLFESAMCFAIESGKSGIVGHERKNCKENTGYAECCSYGMETGKEIIMQLLIDYMVTSLGHRKICLSIRYTKIGISESTHILRDTCCVLDFK